MVNGELNLLSFPFTTDPSPLTIQHYSTFTIHHSRPRPLPSNLFPRTSKCPPHPAFATFSQVFDGEKGCLAPPLVGGRSVDRRHGHIVEAQVDGELPAMVRQMTEGVGDHGVARFFVDDLSSDAQLPRFHQMLVAGC